MTAEDWIREPGRGRYVRIEREQRFLLETVPADAGPPRLIDDVYLNGTTLRLRRVTDGERVVHKLTQKVRLVSDDPSAVALTNIYLTAAEHLRLSALGGDALQKTRRPWRCGGRIWAVDAFAGRWTGLVLAELENDEALTVDLQPPLLADLSHDERFAGGALAAADDDKVAAVLAFARELGRRP